MGSEFLDLAAVGTLLGVKTATVVTYRKRYSTTHPFPAPDGEIGKSPYWNASRVEEIVAWNKARVGQGKGGGRKAVDVGQTVTEDINRNPAEVDRLRASRQSARAGRTTPLADLEN